MSYSYNGRYTQSWEEYQRWQADDAAAEEEQANEALNEEVERLREDLSTTRRDLQSSQDDVRAAARAHAQLEAQHRELEQVQQRLRDRQEAHQRETRRREEQLAGEVRAAELRGQRDLAVAEQRAKARIQGLRLESERRAAQLEERLEDLREDMEEGLEDVRNAVAETRNELGRRIEGVRSELEAERQARLRKESTRAAQARSITDLLRRRVASLPPLASIGLTVEKGRVEARLAQAEEILADADAESALGVAHAALVDLETTTLEYERRVGVIEGVAVHVEHVADAIERLVRDEKLRVVFAADFERLSAGAARLREHAANWRGRLPWTLFEVERDAIVGAANTLHTLAVELRGIGPAVIRQLMRREGLLKEAAHSIAELRGSVDRFEFGYADPEDVKSPRLLRAHIGRARIDTYVELDGTFRMTGCGFETTADCDHAFTRMGNTLSEKWQLTAGQYDPTNPQRAPSVGGPAPEAWRGVGAEIARNLDALGEGAKRR